MDVLVLCGPTGVGKSTLAYELGRQLAIAGVSHAIIDADELDRVYPPPRSKSAMTSLTCRNLRAVWSEFANLGHTRLILCGVFVDLASDLLWINEALEDADVAVVRLHASHNTLRQRLESRERGSGLAEHVTRSQDHADLMRQLDTDDVFTVDTDGLSPGTIASTLFARLVEVE